MHNAAVVCDGLAPQEEKADAARATQAHAMRCNGLLFKKYRM